MYRTRTETRLKMARITTAAHAVKLQTICVRKHTLHMYGLHFCVQSEIAHTNVNHNSSNKQFIWSTDNFNILNMIKEWQFSSSFQTDK